MESTDNPPDQSERRRYVRVQDAVGLHIQQLSDMPAAGQVIPPLERAAVRKRDKYDIDGYAAVRRDHPAVAIYIDDLEERIRQLLLDGDEVAVTPTHKVSLSAGGIHFTDKNLLRPGEMIGITLTLFPSGHRIGTDARILSGNDAPEVGRRDEPSYRAVFVRMSDADRQVVDEHVKRLLEKRTLLQD